MTQTLGIDAEKVCVEKVCIVACGALAHEVKFIISSLPKAANVKFVCLPAILHNYPHLIGQKLEKKILQLQPKFDRILVAYGDCGSGGEIEKVCNKYGASFIHSPHCYAFFATDATFETIQAKEIGTFYLTDFLAKHFYRLVIQGMGIDKHPELQEILFGNYKRLVYLAQQPTPALEQKAKDAAALLHLDYEYIYTGYGDLSAFLEREL